MNKIEPLLPKRPYLVRAMYEWLLDNGLTPHLLVDTSCWGVKVPQQFIKDERIVLNITPQAVGRLDLQDEEITFNARFSGVSQAIVVPMAAVLAIYARENGDGMMFEPEPYYEQLSDDTAESFSQESRQESNPDSSNAKKKPFLRIVE